VQVQKDIFYEFFGLHSGVAEVSISLGYVDASLEKMVSDISKETLFSDILLLED
jgi:hypothetical protein